MCVDQKLSALCPEALQCFWECQTRTKLGQWQIVWLSEALLLSEYCTRLMCFCALGWTVQFGSLSYTNCRSLTALDRFSTMTWPKPRPAKAEATSGEGSLVGLEQWSCCLRYQSGVVPDPRYSSSFLATGGVQGGFLGRHSFIFISSGERDDTGEV